ncbi:hypothetical protein EGW08_014745 [Elysia chlorotica]|uniref:C1q domain-containing protein n=1 Tax=Elysia chlorotica TaxID=188477 RepID=A0A433T7J9_ELYCH|nr:hypothetical protein EGW08_014745 [Elysia chlorotica]
MQLIQSQEKLLSQNLWAKINLIRKDIQQNLDSGHNDFHIVIEELYKLDCLSELLMNTSLKLQDVEEMKLTQACIQADLDASNQKTNGLERKVSDLQQEVEQLMEDNRRLGDQLTRLVSKHNSLKRDVSKAWLQCKESMDKLNKLEAHLMLLDSTVNSVSRLSVGFTAQLKTDLCVDHDTEINSIFHVISNAGNAFQPDSGSFVAPHDGLYGFCIKLEQTLNKNFTIFLVTKTGAAKPVKEMAVPFTQNAPHSAVCVLDLTIGALVLVRIELAGEKIGLKSSLTFSGWSIGYD